MWGRIGSMDDVKKMLRAIINGQSAIKQDLQAEIKLLRGEMDEYRMDSKEEFEKVNRRLDKIGMQLAYLDDDASSREDMDALEKRVKKLEQRLFAS